MNLTSPIAFLAKFYASSQKFVFSTKQLAQQPSECNGVSLSFDAISSNATARIVKSTSSFSETAEHDSDATLKWMVHSGPNVYASCVGFSIHSTIRIAICGLDRSCSIYSFDADKASKECLKLEDLDATSVEIPDMLQPSVVAFSPMSRSLVIGTTCGKLLIWTSAGNYSGPPTILDRHSSRVSALAFCMQTGGKIEVLASGCEQGLVRMWNFSDHALMDTHRVPSSVQNILISRDRYVVIWSGVDELAVVVFDLAASSTHEKSSSWRRSCAIKSDDKLCLRSGGDGFYIVGTRAIRWFNWDLELVSSSAWSFAASRLSSSVWFLSRVVGIDDAKKELTIVGEFGVAVLSTGDIVPGESKVQQICRVQHSSSSVDWSAVLGNWFALSLLDGSVVVGRKRVAATDFSGAVPDSDTVLSKTIAMNNMELCGSSIVAVEDSSVTVIPVQDVVLAANLVEQFHYVLSLEQRRIDFASQTSVLNIRKEHLEQDVAKLRQQLDLLVIRESELSHENSKLLTALEAQQSRCCWPDHPFARLFDDILRNPEELPLLPNVPFEIRADILRLAREAQRLASLLSSIPSAPILSPSDGPSTETCVDSVDLRFDPLPS